MVVFDPRDPKAKSSELKKVDRTDFQILTLHAASPLFVTFGAAGVLAILCGHHHPELETILFMVNAYLIMVRFTSSKYETSSSFFYGLSHR